MSTARNIQVDAVTVHRNQIATTLAEMERREAGGVTVAAFTERAFTKADTFIKITCEQFAGRLPALAPPAAVKPDPYEVTIASDRERALMLLERLAEGDRFIVHEERMGRALQHWVDQGCAALDEEGYFLTPAGRTQAERGLG